MNNARAPYLVKDEGAMVSLGGALASLCHSGMAVFLQGDLGMGKTTLARGLLRQMGHDGAVKSPTYTLVEPYEFPQLTVYHFDLYRVGDAEELELMGIRDYFSENSLCLVEWPERGLGVLPEPDIVIAITSEGSGRVVELRSASDKGALALQELD